MSPGLSCSAAWSALRWRKTATVSSSTETTRVRPLLVMPLTRSPLITAVEPVCVRRRLEWIGNPDRRASEFDPVGVAHGGQSLRTCRAGRQRGELFEEALKPRWRGDHQQPPRDLTDVLEGVRRAARPERHAAGRRPEHGTAGLEPEITLDDIPQLVLTQVGVKR